MNYREYELFIFKVKTLNSFKYEISTQCFIQLKQNYNKILGNKYFHIFY
jgi:hypothetical protein